MFNDLINELALIDPPMSNQSFTWSNMQDNPTSARLDHFLLSTDWDQTFPLYRVEALSRITLDHYPILLTANGNSKVNNKIFRLEEAWLNHEGFRAKLPDW